MMRGSSRINNRLRCEDAIRLAEHACDLFLLDANCIVVLCRSDVFVRCSRRCLAGRSAGLCMMKCAEASVREPWREVPLMSSITLRCCSQLAARRHQETAAYYARAAKLTGKMDPEGWRAVGFFHTDGRRELCCARISAEAVPMMDLAVQYYAGLGFFSKCGAVRSWSFAFPCTAWLNCGTPDESRSSLRLRAKRRFGRCSRFLSIRC
jgi:hypothetical protein